MSQQPGAPSPSGRAPIKRRLLQFWRADPKTDVNDELRFHLESCIADNVAGGMSPDDACDAALRRFGDLEDISRTLRTLSTQRERTMRFAERLDTIRQDLRFAVRQLAKSRVFATIAVLTMALGIGANTAIFSVVHSVLLKPLPFENADRLLVLRERNGANDDDGMVVTVGNYAAWAQQSREFEALGAYYFGGYTLTGRGAAQRVQALMTTASYWKALYIPPALGRYFTADEDQPGAPRVVVLSYALWQSAFAGDSTVVGRTIVLSGEPHTVIGVAASGYALSQRSAGLFAPIRFTPEQLADHGDHELAVIGLVRRGSSNTVALRELTRIETALAAQYTHHNFDGGVLARSERDAVVGPGKSMLLALMGAVGLVLLIACVNVANLLLSRAATRRKEFAIRAAIGAGRNRIVAQLLTESLVLAAAGGAAGLAVAAVTIEFLLAGAPPLVPRLGEASLDGTVLLFTLALSLTCGVVFGLVPAWRASKLNLQDALREGTRGSAAVLRDRLRAALVVAEVSVSLVLLVGAGLCLRSALLLQRVSLGFDAENLLVAAVSLPEAGYESEASVTALFSRLSAAVGAVPGVASVSLISRMPIVSGGADCSIRAEHSVEGDGRRADANVRSASPNYFSTLRVPITRGRTFSAAEEAGVLPVAMISASLAKRLFGDEDPVGQRIVSCMGPPSAVGRALEVVGVVGDMHANGLREDAAREVYLADGYYVQRSMWLGVRTSVPPASLASAVRRAVAQVDPLLPLGGLVAMHDAVQRSMSTQRFMTTLFVLLGVTGVILAAVGIYGVISYLVTQRTHEIGVRMALGASAGRVAGLVVRQGVVLTLIGVVVGSGVSLFASRVLSGLLFGVKPYDPLTFAGVAGLLTLVAVAACLVPAWRATRVDPLAALRSS